MISWRAGRCGPQSGGGFPVRGQIWPGIGSPGRSVEARSGRGPAEGLKLAAECSPAHIGDSDGKRNRTATDTSLKYCVLCHSSVALTLTKWLRHSVD